MPDLVCPECGNGQFKATLTTRTEYTYECDGDSGLLDIAHELVDSGDLDEAGDFVCTDCSEGYEYPETQLVTREAYDAALGQYDDQLSI